MYEWFASNTGNIVVSLLLMTAVVLIIRKLVREKKRGRTACSCSDCGGCMACMYRPPQGS